MNVYSAACISSDVVFVLGTASYSAILATVAEPDKLYQLYDRDLHLCLGFLLSLWCTLQLTSTYKVSLSEDGAVSSSNSFNVDRRQAPVSIACVESRVTVRREGGLEQRMMR